jgi:hypothetical protein
LDPIGLDGLVVVKFSMEPAVSQSFGNCASAAWIERSRQAMGEGTEYQAREA